MKLRDVLAVIDDNETVSISFDYKSLKNCEKLRREHLIDLLDLTVKNIRTEGCSMFFVTLTVSVSENTGDSKTEEMEYFLQVEIETSRNHIKNKEDIFAFNGIPVSPWLTEALNERHIAFCQHLLDKIH
ncbi:hypothetical protein [Clostridium sp. E02]|uniref:hypothetical protein n=1 Tax=Clostridium sp. E02 TaxID=2487134 RepID=UPI000F52898B|nr:hypothetical protein [Clostridium sp. E02]